MHDENYRNRFLIILADIPERNQHPDLYPDWNTYNLPVFTNTQELIETLDEKLPPKDFEISKWMTSLASMNLLVVQSQV